MHWKAKRDLDRNPCRKQSKPLRQLTCERSIETFRMNISSWFWSMRKIDSNLKSIEKWNGILPEVTGAGAIPFIGWVGNEKLIQDFIKIRVESVVFGRIKNTLCFIWIFMRMEKDQFYSITRAYKGFCLLALRNSYFLWRILDINETKKYGMALFYAMEKSILLFVGRQKKQQSPIYHFCRWKSTWSSCLKLEIETNENFRIDPKSRSTSPTYRQIAKAALDV